MALKLDVKDRKILYELDKNSRQSYSSLAKKVGLSQEAVRYRVNSLVGNKAISKFFTVVNVSMLGLTFYKILLKFHNINEKKKEDIINYLIKQDFVAWIADTDGAYDLSFVIEVDNLLKAKEFLSVFYQNYSNQIHARAFSVNLIGEYLTRDYLIDKKRIQEIQPSYSAESSKIELDKINLKIISLLAENSRISAVEIANKFGISADSVLQRIKKLEKLNVLTRYNIVLNHEALNQVHYKVFIYLNNISKQKENSLYTYCRSIPQIVYIINAFGEWDMEIDIEVRNIQEFRKVMMEITSRFSDIIADYTYLVIYKVRKYNLYPKNL